MSKFKVIPFNTDVADAVQIQPVKYVKNDDTEELHKIGGRGEVIIDHTICMVEVADVVVTYASGKKAIVKPDVFAKEFVHADGAPIELDEAGMIVEAEKQAEPQSEPTPPAAK